MNYDDDESLSFVGLFRAGFEFLPEDMSPDELIQLPQSGELLVA